MERTATSALGLVSRLAFVGRGRVPSLIAAIAAAAVVLYYLSLASLEPPLTNVHIPWWSFALVFFLTEAVPVHVHFRSEAHSLSLSELGVVLALYLASPGGLLLAQALGAGLALLFIRRQRPLKLAFNMASFALSSCLAVVVFHASLRLGPADGPAGWAGAVLGAATSAVAGVLLVSIVIW